jgi:hypothetical protein
MGIPWIDILTLASHCKDNPKIYFSDSEKNKKNKEYMPRILDITCMIGNNILLINEIVSQ